LTVFKKNQKSIILEVNLKRYFILLALLKNTRNKKGKVKDLYHILLKFVPADTPKCLILEK